MKKASKLTFECDDMFMEYWTALHWKFASDESDCSSAMAMKSWLVITSGNFFTAGWNPRAQQKNETHPTFRIILE